jgi:hypothetical protein
MATNLDVEAADVPAPGGEVLYALPEGAGEKWRETGRLPARSIVVTIEKGEGGAA